MGNKWLGRKAEVISKKGLTQSFVTVWNTITEHDQAGAKQLIRENSQAQADAIMALWKSGDIENVYFDIEGTQQLNDVTDFVFFVNAKSEAEAKAVCDKLPFAQKNISTYKLYPAGVFWLGENK